MKQMKSLSEFSCLSEYTRLYTSRVLVACYVNLTVKRDNACDFETTVNKTIFYTKKNVLSILPVKFAFADQESGQEIWSDPPPPQRKITSVICFLLRNTGSDPQKYSLLDFKGSKSEVTKMGILAH